MKSKSFDTFYDRIHSELYSHAKNSVFFQKLMKKLNIFITPEKRTSLIQDKIEYIFSNMGLPYVKIKIDEVAKYPKYTKNKEAVFPESNEEKNFFDTVFIISEIILTDILGRSKTYESEFAAIYKYAVSKVFRLEEDLINKVFQKNGITLENSIKVIYDDFSSKDVWKIIHDSYGFKLNDMKSRKNKNFQKYTFENNSIEIVVYILENNRIKAFEFLKSTD